MVETRGYTLEEVAFAFDGPNDSLAGAMLPHMDDESHDASDKARDEDKTV